MIKNGFVSVILPLALPREYTYSVPEEYRESVSIGKRVEVELKRKLYSAVICNILDEFKTDYSIKPILEILDDKPILSDIQLRSWQWIADYYCCTMGEVMQAALPSGLKLESETKIILAEDADHDFTALGDEEYLVAEAIHIRKVLTIQEICDILDKKSIYPIIRTLLDHRIIDIQEELKEKYRPKKIRAIKLTPEFYSEEVITEFIDKKVRSEAQERALLAYLTITKGEPKAIPVTEIYELGRVNNAILKALEKKGIFIIEEIEVSRVSYYGDEVKEVPPLSEEQVKGINIIQHYFDEKKPVLVHGITGSGKTRMYIEMIEKTLQMGQQVLYLLPEIALTTQIVERLENYFGADIITYHSKLNHHERVEVWNAVMQGKKIVLGARSSLFLPFQNLGLIIVDEEHDPSYKQVNPSPRYNARDVAVVLSKMVEANIILGTATPSLESYYNTSRGKYGIVTLNRRFGDAVLPNIEIVDLKKEKQMGRLKDTTISHLLKTQIKEVLSNQKQVIIFQNRRGFAPVVQCSECGWIAECKNCDVTLTLHRYFKEMRCHYCGYRHNSPPECPDCGSHNLYEIGQGTERIEEDLKQQFPDARVARMDFDTAKTKNAMEKIIYDFSNQKIDILVGTQMVTKGFDFDHLALVGIINADSLTKFPDFRAGERAFQLMTQVAGRAGRRGEQGKVIIQTFQPDQPVIYETIHNLYERYYNREMHERKEFKYPPLYRMISIELKHSNREKLAEASRFFADLLKKRLAGRVQGPIVPSISRIKNKYIELINIKTEQDPKIINFAKKLIIHTRGEMMNIKGIKGVRTNINVDPY